MVWGKGDLRLCGFSRPPSCLPPYQHLIFLRRGHGVRVNLEGGGGGQVLPRPPREQHHVLCFVIAHRFRIFFSAQSLLLNRTTRATPPLAGPHPPRAPLTLSRTTHPTAFSCVCVRWWGAGSPRCRRACAQSRARGVWLHFLLSFFQSKTGCKKHKNVLDAHEQMGVFIFSNLLAMDMPLLRTTRRDWKRKQKQKTGRHRVHT